LAFLLDDWTPSSFFNFFLDLQLLLIIFDPILHEEVCWGHIRRLIGDGRLFFVNLALEVN